jgi:hypothetical protein
MTGQVCVYKLTKEVHFIALSAFRKCILRAHQMQSRAPTLSRLPYLRGNIGVRCCAVLTVARKYLDLQNPARQPVQPINQPTNQPASQSVKQPASPCLPSFLATCATAMSLCRQGAGDWASIFQMPPLPPYQL